MKHLVYSLLLSLLLMSCAQKRVLYIQSEAGKLDAGEEYAIVKPDYKLLNEDILYIKLSTTNEDIKDLIDISPDGSSMQNSMSNQQGGNFYLSGYTVNDSGYIDIPILGLVKVGGLTISDATSVIQSRTNEVFEGAKATVKLVSYKITWLGEVGAEGPKYYMQDNVNIIEALAGVGGVSAYGDRENILILRKTEKGYKSFRVDVTKRELISSDLYYLQPNDIVYVEATKTKVFKTGISDFFFYMSTVLTILSTVLLVSKL